MYLCICNIQASFTLNACNNVCIIICQYLLLPRNEMEAWLRVLCDITGMDYKREKVQTTIEPPIMDAIEITSDRGHSE